MRLHTAKEERRVARWNSVGKQGFTLLLAALVASIVVSLGISIFQVARKQVLLSGVGRDSQFAFYAADTAAECALYWDFRFSYFAPTTPALTPKCDGVLLTITTVTDLVGTPLSQPYTYPYIATSNQMGLFSGANCAQISVKKEMISGAVRSKIHADGYSVPCNQIATAPRALQRSIELNY